MKNSAIDTSKFTRKGELKKTSPPDRVRQGSYQQVHEIKLKAKNTYSIDLTSSDFDTYLRLEDTKGTFLSQNDDGGDGLNSRLVFRPTQDGTYRIVVTSFRPKQIGVYQLTVRKSELGQLLGKIQKSWIRKGFEHKRNKRYREAITAFTEAIKQTPTNVIAYRERGFIYYYLKNNSQAIENFNEALRLGAGNTTSFWCRGLAYANLSQWDKANNDFAESLKRGANYTSLWQAQALTKLALKDTEGYRSLCATMFRRFGKSTKPQTANLLAWVAVLAPDALNDPTAAIDRAKIAVTGMPKDHAAANTLGAAYYRAGKYKEAINSLQKAITLHDKGGSPQDYLFLAMAHAKLKQTNDARKWLKKAQLWMDNQQRQELEEELHKVRALSCLPSPLGQGQFLAASTLFSQGNNTSSRLPWTYALELSLHRQEAEALVAKLTDIKNDAPEKK